MLTHYNSSKGPVEIGKMPLSYARNALNKLARTAPERKDEIEALQSHVDTLAAEAEAKALAGDENPRAVIGGNNPPEDIPADPAPVIEGRAAVEAHVSDLLTEAANWADGVPIATEGQAHDVGVLLRKLQEAAGLVKDTADKEKKPLNEKLAEIGDWQNGYIAKGLKTKPDGSLTKAIVATGNLSAAWLRKLDDERKAKEAELAAAAAKAAQEAVAAREEAKASTDLADMDRAEDALSAAKALIREAEGVSKERVKAGGGDGYKAVSLRSVWRAEVTNYGEAYAHYKKIPEFMDDFHDLIRTWAARDARNEATRRAIPGVLFHEDKVV